MDSFTMIFQAELNVSQVACVLQDAGFAARLQGTDRVVVTRGIACLWILVCKPDDLDASDFEDASQWPIPRDRLMSLFNISVRRNLESEDLAIEVADRLVTALAGAIIWDGMDQWERRYTAYIERKGGYRVTGSDSTVTDDILEAPAKCPHCRREILEKTLVEPE